VVRNGTYVKHHGPPVADPNLFSVYPSDGLVPGQGTSPSEGFWAEELLGLVMESIET